MINLNKKLVDKDGLKKYVTDIDVYRLYTNSDIVLNTSLKSPLRHKDDNPSFSYFLHNETKEIFFKDHSMNVSGDFVRFVQLLFHINYFEALSKIAIDFNKQYNFIVKPMKPQSISLKKTFPSRDEILKNASTSHLDKKSRDWKLHDIKYWMEYGIDKDILHKYRVQPLSHIFINGKIINADKYCYCFTEYKDKQETYKIYQPFNNDFKWLSNHNSSVWQGWEQLPEKGDELIITKSLKDVMAITNIMDIPCVALQTESIEPKENIVEELRNRFNHIYLLYDNDFDKEINWGFKFSEELSNKFNFKNIYIQDEYKSKDFTDLVKNVGKDIAKDILDDIILSYLPF